MKHSSDLDVDAPAATVVEALADLSTYPEWNDLVSQATPAAFLDGDPGPAWLTTLRAQVGPFARSKQLRLVRDDSTNNGGSWARMEPSDSPVQLCFVRREQDDRSHAQWNMRALVTPAGQRSQVTLELSYDGGLWVPALGSILGGAIDRATERLPSYLESR